MSIILTVFGTVLALAVWQENHGQDSNRGLEK